ncbi:YdcF family protein [Clostridium septicum]|uniref:YdcF family protein n=1 Tax=Clostridium septicum TaxID=1504 RepID=A0A9N7JKH6_CLOSE|nr:YdcF family protein [Clostridium septicum]AYE33562.1 YdcF family protein [Clostridium septicum]QAS61725.1 YdcF family protein [Clostridium septicum]UEC21830.1 YdcF family protein [Clostridium septicum]USS00118.1 YdcF family protein [Clostridium septicum]WLF68664.1 YdcF family protein [Clostridium septicum]
MEKLKKNINLIIGIVLCIYVVLINLICGKVSFSYSFFILGIILIIYHFIKDKIKGINKVLKVVKPIILVFIIIFITIEAAIILYPKKNIDKADYMIILGAGLKGEKLSMTLEQRLNKALEYIENYDNGINIVVSGGQGPGEDITEAEAMKRYLIKNGVKEDNIIMENKSTSTSENLIYSKEKIENIVDGKIKSVKIKVVTSDFHAFRSNMLAKRNGYEKISFYTNNTFFPLIPIMYTREFLAVIKSYILD